VIRAGETLAKVNKNGDRFEVELLLLDASGNRSERLRSFSRTSQANDTSQFKKRAEAIRDELGAQIPQVAKLTEPLPAIR